MTVRLPVTGRPPRQPTLHPVQGCHANPTRRQHWAPASWCTFTFRTGGSSPRSGCFAPRLPFPSFSSLPSSSYSSPSSPRPSSRGSRSHTSKTLILVYLAFALRIVAAAFASDIVPVRLTNCDCYPLLYPIRICHMSLKTNTTRCDFYRWSFRWRKQRWRFQPSLRRSQFTLLPSNRPSSRCASHPDLFRIGCSCASSCALPFAAISAGPFDSSSTNASRFPPRLPSRYSTLRPASAMGRMDRSCSNNSPDFQRCSHVCYATDAGQPESTKEADCGKC